jgi:hypothetical protein
MTMKKAHAFLFLFIALTLAACSGPTEPKPEIKELAENVVITLKYSEDIEIKAVNCKWQDACFGDEGHLICWGEYEYKWDPIYGWRRFLDNVVFDGMAESWRKVGE